MTRLRSTMRPFTACVLGLFALLAASSCSSGAPRPSRASVAGAVIPAGETRFFSFDRAQVELAQSDSPGPVARSKVADVPATAGAPRAAAFDPRGSFGAVAYERGLAWVRLATGDIAWLEPGFTRPPDEICVRNDVVATVSADRVTLHTLPDGRSLLAPEEEDVGRWLRRSQLETLDYVVPTQAREFVIVGTRKMSLLEGAKVAVLKLDLDRPAEDAVVSGPNEIEEITFLGASAFDGEAFFLAGTLEQVRRSPGIATPGELLHSLVVVRIDPNDLRRTVVVRDALQSNRVAVRSLAVDRDLFAVTMDDGEVRAYRPASDGRASLVWSDRIGADGWAACLSSSSLAIASGGGVRVVRF